MNIIELTRILNEMNNVSEPAKKTIDVVKMFDKSVESSGDSNEIHKKDRFLGKVTNIIEDEIDNNQNIDKKSIRNKIINLADNLLSGKNKNLLLSYIKEIIYDASNEIITNFANAINDERLTIIANGQKHNILKQCNNSLVDKKLIREFDKFIKTLGGLSVIGMGPWEIVLGLLCNGQRAKTGGDIIVNGVTYEVKSSGNGTIDDKTMRRKYRELHNTTYGTQNSNFEADFYLKAFFDKKPNVIVIDKNGNYVTLNRQNYLQTIAKPGDNDTNGKVAVLSFKPSGANTNFGSYTLSLL